MFFIVKHMDGSILMYCSRLHLTDSESSSGLGRLHFLFRQGHPVRERLQRRFVLAPATLVGSLLVVLLHPVIQVVLQLVYCLIDLLPDCHPVEFV